MSGYSYKFWDPTGKQDYQIHDHGSNDNFSAIESGFLVVEITGSFPLLERKMQLTDLFVGLSTVGCFTHSPWTRKSEKALCETCNFSRIEKSYGGEIKGIFAPKNFGQLITIWAESGGTQSGEWQFVGLSDHTEDEAAAFSLVGPLSRILSISNVRVYLELREMQQIFLYVRHSKLAHEKTLLFVEGAKKST